METGELKKKQSYQVNVLFADGLDHCINRPPADMMLSILNRLPIFSGDNFNNHYHLLVKIAVNYTYLHFFKQTWIQK